MSNNDKKFSKNPLNIEEISVLGYLETLARIQSGAIQKEKNRLRKSEVKFFALVCYLKYLGYDIENHRSLVKGLEDVGHPMKSTTVSQYKTRLSIKNWIQSELNVLNIPPRYDLRKYGTDFTLNLWLKENEDNGSGIQE